MTNLLLAFVAIAVTLLLLVPLTNAQQLTSIPSGMHKCLGFVLSMNSLKF